jgi:hypothetical protein
MTFYLGTSYLPHMCMNFINNCSPTMDQELPYFELMTLDEIFNGKVSATVVYREFIS